MPSDATNVPLSKPKMSSTRPWARGSLVVVGAVTVLIAMQASCRVGASCATEAFRHEQDAPLSAYSSCMMLIMNAIDPLDARILLALDDDPEATTLALILFRHKSSLGGLNTVALLAQERFGWRAGYVQLALDGTIIVASLAIVAPAVVALSAAGAVVLNLVLALNHRPGRYLGH